MFRLSIRCFIQRNTQNGGILRNHRLAGDKFGDEAQPVATFTIDIIEFGETLFPSMNHPKWGRVRGGVCGSACALRQAEMPDLRRATKAKKPPTRNTRERPVPMKRRSESVEHRPARAWRALQESMTICVVFASAATIATRTGSPEKASAWMDAAARRECSSWQPVFGAHRPHALRCWD